MWGLLLRRGLRGLRGRLVLLVLRRRLLRHSLRADAVGEAGLSRVNGGGGRRLVGCGDSLHTHLLPRRLDYWRLLRRLRGAAEFKLLFWWLNVLLQCTEGRGQKGEGGEASGAAGAAVRKR